MRRQPGICCITTNNLDKKRISIIENRFGVSAEFSILATQKMTNFLTVEDSPQHIFRSSRYIPRKATNDTFSLAMNINSSVAQACNSLLFRAFAPCS